MKEILTTIESMGTIVIVLTALYRILLPVAVYLDCKARNIGAKIAYTISVFFFPVIAGIFYAIKRKSAPKAFKICKTCGKKVGTYTNTCPSCGGLFLAEYKHPKEKQLKTASIVLCVIALICYVISSAVNLPDEIDRAKDMVGSKIDTEDEIENEYDYDDDFELGSSELCYDKDGRAYSNEYSVLYFSKDGNVYQHIFDEDGEYFINKDSGNRINKENAFVDNEGYFYVIKEGLTHNDPDPYKYTISGSENTDAVTVEVTFSDDEGNVYYRATEASWNYSGKTLICGNTLN